MMTIRQFFDLSRAGEIAAFACKHRFPRTFLVEVRTGKRIPSPKNAKRLCEALSCSMDELREYVLRAATHAANKIGSGPRGKKAGMK